MCHPYFPQSSKSSSGLLDSGFHILTCSSIFCYITSKVYKLMHSSNGFIWELVLTVRDIWRGNTYKTELAWVKVRWRPFVKAFSYEASCTITEWKSPTWEADNTHNYGTRRFNIIFSRAGLHSYPESHKYSADPTFSPCFRHQVSCLYYAPNSSQAFFPTCSITAGNLLISWVVLNGRGVF
jgi:hypothetical protein